MTDLILHHYPQSPFAEKIRLALGLKHLAYHCVTIPIVMPKPDLTPLTGGYRRTPVLQIGADIYCDTLLILDVLEQHTPTPSLYPGANTGLAKSLAWSFEKSMFWSAVQIVCGLVGEHFPDAFFDDRKTFTGLDLSKQACLQRQPAHLQKLQAHLHWLAQMLPDGRAFLLGAEPSAADLAAYHVIWFIRENTRAAGDALIDFAPLLGWYGRVAALGHSTPTDLSAAEALSIAHLAEPVPPAAPEGAPPGGCKLGAQVSVTADDAGRDPIAGTLVAFSQDSVTIAREDALVGRVHVHFPRAGFEVKEELLL